jgi:hypothetical protein
MADGASRSLSQDKHSASAQLHTGAAIQQVVLQDDLLSLALGL